MTSRWFKESIFIIQGTMNAVHHHANIFSFSLPEDPTKDIFRFATRREALSRVLHEGCSQRAQVD